MKVTYISWAESCSRSDNTARELGGKSHLVYLAKLGSHPATILFKYFGQSVMTWRKLKKDRPEAVFVMSPPVIAAIPVYLYCKRKKIPFVIDAHTGAFLHPRWVKFQWLQRFFSRKAATTIVTNNHLKKMVEDGGGHATIVRDVPVKYNIEEQYPLNGKVAIAAVCSFTPDEPILEIFDAARKVDGVHLYMTGKYKDLDPEIAKQKPDNVTFTGFIPDAQYGSLISDADAVLALTTRDHTMLRAAYEAIYHGTPVIISDWPLLRESFDRGAIHTDNSAASISAAIEEIKNHKEKYREDALALQSKKYRDWAMSKQALADRVNSYAWY